MNFIRTTSRILSWIESSLVIVLFSVMVLLAFLQVILRNIFDTGILWADPFLRHLVLWIGFLGASLATQQDRHISLDLISRFTSPRFTNATRILTYLFAGVVSGILAYSGWKFLNMEMEFNGILFTIGKTNYPSWWFLIIIPIGFSLMAFRFLLRTIEYIRVTVKPESSSDHPPSITPFES